MKSTIWISCIIIFLKLFSFSSVQAQRLPFFNHYFDNPYIYNPAYAGYDKHSVFYLTHRQQWLGVEGAPMSTQLSFHTPLGNANPLFIGGDIMNDQLGALSHTAVKFTSAYLIPLSEENEHYIKTAFSAGLGMHSYDFGSMDIGDDAVLQAAQGNNMYLDGRFGIRYHNQGFNLSIALPHLFTPPAVLNDGFSQPGIDQLSRMIVSTHYRFDFNPEGGISFEPTVLYHYNREGTSQMEGMGVFYYRSRQVGKQQEDLFWFGGSYQQQSGIGGIAGVRVKNLKFSYAFSTGGSAVSAYGMGSHEIQLGFIIGKKKVMLKRKPRLRTGVINEEVPDEALIKKHAKSSEKSKKEDLPNRKRVLPEQKETSQRKIGISADEAAVADKEATEGEAQVPSEVETSTDGKANIQSKKQENSDTLKRQADTEPIEKASAPQKKDYSNMEFDSFESPENGVIQLDQQPQQNVSANAKESPVRQELKNAETKSESSQPDQAALNQRKDTGSNAQSLAMQEGYYIVAGTFSAESNARKLASRLVTNGYQAAVGYHDEKQYYYVYAAQAATLTKAQEALAEMKQTPSLSNAWILRVKSK